MKHRISCGLTGAMRGMKLAQQPFHVVLLGVAHAAQRHDGGLAGVVAGFGGQVLAEFAAGRRACRRRTGWPPCIPSGRPLPAASRPGPADAARPGSGRSGGRTLRARRHSAPRAPAARPMPTASAAIRMFRVQAVQDVLEATAFLADPVGHGDGQPVDEQHVRVHGLATHFLDLPDFHLGPVQVRIEQRQALGGLVHLRQRVVRASSSILCATWAVEIQILRPWTTYCRPGARPACPAWWCPARRPARSRRSRPFRGRRSGAAASGGAGRRRRTPPPDSARRCSCGRPTRRQSPRRTRRWSASSAPPRSCPGRRRRIPAAWRCPASRRGPGRRAAARESRLRGRAPASIRRDSVHRCETARSACWSGVNSKSIWRSWGSGESGERATPRANRASMAASS